MSAPAASVATAGRGPHWSDPAHQAAITAAFDCLAATLSGPVVPIRPLGRTAGGPAPHRVRELGRLAAASQLPARAALLRWGALPPAVRHQLLTGWFRAGA